MEGKVYIAGKITGDPCYRFKFAKAESELRALGYTKIMNPAVISEGFDWKEYMDITTAMLKVCDTIYLLKDWKESQGAKIEKTLAEAYKYTILYQNPVNATKNAPKTPNKNND